MSAEGRSIWSLILPIIAKPGGSYSSVIELNSQFWTKLALSCCRNRRAVVEEQLDVDWGDSCGGTTVSGVEWTGSKTGFLFTCLPLVSSRAKTTLHPRVHRAGSYTHPDTTSEQSEVLALVWNTVHAGSSFMAFFFSCGKGGWGRDCWKCKMLEVFLVSARWRVVLTVQWVSQMKGGCWTL